jgi:urease accessory protein UreH
LFDEYDNATIVLSAGEPIVYDRFVLRPGKDEYRAVGRLESHTVSACLYLIHGGSEKAKAVVEAVAHTLFDDTILAGTSAIDAGGLVVRVLGQAVPPVQKALVCVIATIRKLLFAAEDQGLLERLIGAL